jgi:formylglycine-generating enzyme required for sulfatase activity
MKNKKTILGIFISTLLVGCFLQREQYDEVRKTPKLKYETPPGTVWLRNNLFMDQTETRNLDYLEFLYWTKRHEPEKYNSILPDTLLWKDRIALQEPYVFYYLRHPAYRDYPVVGISYAQAVAFCKWRSDRVNEFIWLREHPIKNKDYKADSIYPHPEVMRYRLPTKEEWEFASAAGLEYSYFPLGYEKITDQNNRLVSNTHENSYLYIDYKKQKKHIETLMTSLGGNVGMVNDVSDITMPVYSGEKNKYGIYNLLGNVSEIIADSLFKGLNYENTIDGSTLKLQKENYQRTDSIPSSYDYKYTFRYQQQQAWLGFRCVCEVLKEK